MDKSYEKLIDAVTEMAAVQRVLISVLIGRELITAEEFKKLKERAMAGINKQRQKAEAEAIKEDE